MTYDLKLAAAICHKFEGVVTVKGNPKLCPAYPDPLNKNGDGSPWTIGFGSCFYKDGSKVKKGDVISYEEAEELFLHTLKTKYAAAVLKEIKPQHLNYNRFSACTSWVYNLGTGRLRTASWVKLLNAGEYERAAESMASWFSPGSRVEKGLKRRRNAEKEIFLKPC